MESYSPCWRSDETFSWPAQTLTAFALAGGQLKRAVVEVRLGELLFHVEDIFHAGQVEDTLELGIGQVRVGPFRVAEGDHRGRLVPAHAPEGGAAADDLADRVAVAGFQKWISPRWSPLTASVPVEFRLAHITVRLWPVYWALTEAEPTSRIPARGPTFPSTSAYASCRESRLKLTDVTPAFSAWGSMVCCSSPSGDQNRMLPSWEPVAIVRPFGAPGHAADCAGRAGPTARFRPGRSRFRRSRQRKRRRSRVPSGEKLTPYTSRAVQVSSCSVRSWATFQMRMLLSRRSRRRSVARRPRPTWKRSLPCAR